MEFNRCLRRTRGRTVARIRRNSGKREVGIFGEIDETTPSSGEVIAALSEGQLPEIAARHGVGFRFAGKAEEQAQTFGDMKTGAMIGLAAIYIILARLQIFTHDNRVLQKKYVQVYLITF